MNKSVKKEGVGVLLLLCLLISVFGSSSAQTCSSYSFSRNRVYATCTDLPVLNSFLHWTYHQSNGTVDIAYRHGGVDTSTWVAWALNINGSGMRGAQSLVALHNSSSGVPHAYTSSVDGYVTNLAKSDLSFRVPSLSAEYVNSEMIIHASLVLPSSSRTSFNQVWQAGPVSSGGSPGRHLTSGANTQSVGTVDFASGQVSSTGGSQQRKRNVHGVLNAVSWGTLMPLGAIIARYLKVFKSADPAWFYLHVACQSSAYIVGVAGWATGLKLGSDSVGITHTTHRNIGITLFCLGTLQVFALLLRPKKDHKYRLYWNVYHWTVGYTAIILSIVNIFEGLDILDPGKNWKKAYIGVIIFLGFNAVMLEAYTWYIILKRKKTSSDKYPHVGNGSGNSSHQQV